MRKNTILVRLSFGFDAVLKTTGVMATAIKRRIPCFYMQRSLSSLTQVLNSYVRAEVISFNSSYSGFMCAL